MMYSYPFFSFPHTRWGYSHYPRYNTKNSTNPNTSFPVLPKKEEKKHSHLSENKPKEPYFFEIFGLKLYYDDVLLICLIFFLYQENIQDQYLMIILILLLIS